VTVDLFAGTPVSDLGRALPWYRRLLGCPPAFFPHDAEAVWEVAEHRYLYVVHLPQRAGHAVHTLFVDDLDARLAAIAARGWIRCPVRRPATASARWSNATRTATRSGSAVRPPDAAGALPGRGRLWPARRDLSARSVSRTPLRTPTPCFEAADASCPHGEITHSDSSTCPAIGLTAATMCVRLDERGQEVSTRKDHH